MMHAPGEVRGALAQADQAHVQEGRTREVKAFFPSILLYRLSELCNEGV
jgi:hypothetical protein